MLNINSALNVLKTKQKSTSLSLSTAVIAVSDSYFHIFNISRLIFLTNHQKAMSYSHSLLVRINSP